MNWEQIFRMANTTDGTAPPPPGLPVGAVSGQKGGAMGNLNRLRIRTLAPEAERRRQRADSTATMYDQALSDPTGTADLFGKYFDQRAQALTAEATRNYGQQIGGVTANVASRFGGNASSYEQAAAERYTDMAHRNLTESLAALAPQQVAAGQAYTGQLGQAAGQAEGSYENALQILLASLGMQRQNEKDKKASSLGGTLLGGGLGLATKLAGPISVGM